MSFELPVQYAAGVNTVVVAPGRPETKVWWRNLAQPASVEVLVSGRWQPGCGVLVRPGEPDHDVAMETYRQRWPRVRLPADSPRVRLPADSPLVLVRFTSRLSPAGARTPQTPPDAG